MSSSLKLLILCLSVYSSYAAPSFNASYEKKTGHNGWTTNWDTVHVVKNEIVTIAIVPKLGGRVMQYDLGTNKSIYVYNGSQVPASGNDMVGGFRMLPSPQSDFSWPSPPSLDFKPYTCTVRANTADSVVVYLESQIENSTDAKYQKHQGLQFKRLITVYKASTRVKVEMTMLNKGTQTLNHGIWDITQTACTNASNCWVYFQRNAASTLGGGKGYVQYLNEGTDATQWKPDAAEAGIMGVQYLKKVGKIGADCKAGWICFNDRTSGYAYVKTFTYQEGKTYPDSGASVQVYTYKDYDMSEVEVLGPLVNLAAGDSTKLVENWYAARSLGPVLAVSACGLVTKKLTAQQTADSVTLTGTYGIFYPGMVKTQFCSTAGSVVATPDSAAVAPNDSLRVNKKLNVPAGAVSIRIAAFNAAGALVGTLDSTAVPNPTSAGNRRGVVTTSSLPITLTTTRTHGVLSVTIPRSGTFTTRIYSVNGQQIATFSGTAPYCHVFTLRPSASNVLVVRISGTGEAEYRRVIATQRK